MNSTSPKIVQIDASAHCQLACPSCPTASGATRAVLGAGHLDIGSFEELLVRNPGIREVELSNYGEMFLNPRLVDLLRIAEKREVVLHADNGTNLNYASDESLEALVLYRFRSLTVSIDGASPETYSRYRVKGDFDRVIAHIEKINRFKRKHKSGFPLLTWQFIVFGHNELEIKKAQEKARELGMNFRPKISWDDHFSPVRDTTLVHIQTGLHATRDAHYEATGQAYLRSICHQLWHAPVLNWDGKLLGCCRNFWGDFGGNAFHDSIEASIGASKIPAARRALMGQTEMLSDAPCATCDLFLTMKRDGKWISREELEQAAPQPGVLVSVVLDPSDSPATHVDIFAAPGHEVNRLLFARPPMAQRFEVGKSFSVVLFLSPGKHLLYALPKQLDPTYRRTYPALPAVTMPIEVAERPSAQEFTIRLSK